MTREATLEYVEGHDLNMFRDAILEYVKGCDTRICQGTRYLNMTRDMILGYDEGCDTSILVYVNELMLKITMYTCSFLKHRVINC